MDRRYPDDRLCHRKPPRQRVFDLDDIVDRFVAWMKSQLGDIGVHTHKILQAAEGEFRWRIAMKAYVEIPTNALTISRCASLALFF